MKTWGRYGQFSDATTKKAFFSRIKKRADGCWIWTGALGGGGRYGSIGYQGKAQLAHRVAWKLFKGHVSDDLCVCHSCDVGHCVNPNHLFLGTQSDNVADMESKKRARHPSCADHGRAKLTWNDIHRMRALHAKGMALRAIARLFPQVDRNTVSSAVKGITWVTK